MAKKKETLLKENVFVKELCTLSSRGEGGAGSNILWASAKATTRDMFIFGGGEVAAALGGVAGRCWRRHGDSTAARFGWSL